jgi:TonB family protein
MNRTFRIRHAAAVVALVIGAALAAPADAAAQDRVYAANEVQSPPSVKSPSAAASTIQRSMPGALAAVGGRVQLRFVVEPNGKVEESTVEVMAASANALGEAAKKAVTRIEFKPALIDGQPVRSMVMFPVVYAAQ